MFVCSVCVCEGIARKDHDAPSNQDFICSHEWQMLGSAAVAGAAVASVLEIKTLQSVLDFICSHECQYIDARLRRRKSNTSAPPTPGCAAASRGGAQASPWSVVCVSRGGQGPGVAYARLRRGVQCVSTGFYSF